jgi:hypothetical protein
VRLAEKFKERLTSAQHKFLGMHDARGGGWAGAPLMERGAAAAELDETHTALAFIIASAGHQDFPQLR